MSHARRFKFLLIIYLPISLQLRLATGPMTCVHCLSHETHFRGPLTVGGPGSSNLLNPLLLRHWWHLSLLSRASYFQLRQLHVISRSLSRNTNTRRPILVRALFYSRIDHCSTIYVGVSPWGALHGFMRACFLQLLGLFVVFKIWPCHELHAAFRLQTSCLFSGWVAFLLVCTGQQIFTKVMTLRKWN